ncbi:MAG TPA: hypothetical protein VK892_17790 [Pyrinomonadaceae bacterium]|nr:hypothetical protein [Pyrinomonadaceae bacterium]
MIKISPESPEKAILEFVKSWMKLLAENRLDEACVMIDEPNCYGIVWTPELIIETVNETFSPDTIFYEYFPEGPIFTDPYKLPEQKNREVIEFVDKSGYVFEYDIPLNGEWSDLTAQFEFLKRENGYAVILHDLHVM